ncbi:hypothetical protein BDQ17DRAFT_141190 [Cyathus striatus]|nr:hypothetical protein BDQ17DRAFT_141190 [Cyathus striatus]
MCTPGWGLCYALALRRVVLGLWLYGCIRDCCSLELCKLSTPPPSSSARRVCTIGHLLGLLRLDRVLLYIHYLRFPDCVNVSHAIRCVMLETLPLFSFLFIPSFLPPLSPTELTLPPSQQQVVKTNNHTNHEAMPQAPVLRATLGKRC